MSSSGHNSAGKSGSMIIGSADSEVSNSSQVQAQGAADDDINIEEEKEQELAPFVMRSEQERRDLAEQQTQ